VLQAALHGPVGFMIEAKREILLEVV